VCVNVLLIKRLYTFELCVCVCLNCSCNYYAIILVIVVMFLQRQYSNRQFKGKLLLLVTDFFYLIVCRCNLICLKMFESVGDGIKGTVVRIVELNETVLFFNFAQSLSLCPII